MMRRRAVPEAVPTKLVSDHTVIAGIVGIEGIVSQDLECHVGFLPADEVEPVALLGIVPEAKIDAGLVPNDDDLTTLGSMVAQVIGFGALERMHVVLGPLNFPRLFGHVMRLELC